MDKKSIFTKIDDMYTKATKIIIGDIPHDGDAAQNTTITTEEIGIKKKLISLKEKILTLGTPDERSMLYEEVVKKEGSSQISLKDKPTKKATTTKRNIKKPLSTVTPEEKTTINKKVKSTKSTSKTQTKQETSKALTSKQTSIKKSIAKKSTSQKPSEKKATIKKEGSTKKSTIKTTPSSKTDITKKDSSTKTVEKTKKPKVKNNKTTIKQSEKGIIPKTKSAPRGAQKAAKIALYIKDIQKHYGEVDEDFVAIIVKNLGPSIYKKDAELVSCSDPKELDTVRKSFLKKKLGIDASKGVLDAAIQDVCSELKGVRRKYRATFYYALAKKFKKESVLS